MLFVRHRCRDPVGEADGRTPVSGGKAVVARAKFRVPRLPNATVRRSALITPLASATEAPLSLVVAAPGSGKTALLAQWVSDLDGPVAWMSCDSSDADATRFWRNFATAVALAWDGIGVAAAELADTDSGEQIAIGLANELGSLGQPGVIVIDDFHCAGPEPAVMTGLISALPPLVRLVLGSRSDPPFPLGRLRLQGRLLELRQDDLGFTSDEARQLMVDLGVDLGGDDLEQLIAVTEGWPAGVHLAGLSLRARPNPTGLLRALIETDHSLVDFLVNEVIELQPPEVVEFLMMTAELESFDAALCDAVTGRHDSVEMLSRVRSANLFLVELDQPGGWYRYHHLFAQFLRGRLRALAPERVPVIHGAAAEAYSQRGAPMSAVRHSLRAGDTAAALGHLESYGTGAWSIEDQTTGGTTARAWLDEHGAPHLDSSPQSILLCTIVLNLAGDNDDPQPWLELVEARGADLDAQTRLLLEGAWSFHHLQRGDPASALDRARRSEKILSEGDVDSVWVQLVTSMLVQAQVWLDELDGARATLEAARVGSVLPPVVARVRLPAFAAQVEALRGNLTEAERLATAALTAADQLGLDDGNFGRADAHLALATTTTERNQLETAEVHLELAMRIVEEGRRRPLELLVHLQLAQIAAARGDGPASIEAIEQARAVFPHAASPVIAHIDQVDARLALDRGDLATATALRARLPSSATADLLAARLRLATGDRAGTRELLEAMADRMSTTRMTIEHDLLTALATADTERRRADDALHHALALAQPAGFERTLVAEGPALWRLLESLPAHGRIADYIAEILETADLVSLGPATVTQQGMVDPLSERELTVLRYLASRLTCAEIARELYLSVNTVRSHVKAVYRKLGVHSRSAAVARGHALGAA
jgi:LuxR family maltose regulon positive regulatory protein